MTEFSKLSEAGASDSFVIMSFESLLSLWSIVCIREGCVKQKTGTVSK